MLNKNRNTNSCGHTHMHIAFESVVILYMRIAFESVVILSTHTHTYCF